MFVALVLGTAASLAPAPLAQHAIDDGIVPKDLRVLTWVVVLYVFSSLVVWVGNYLQTYLTGWVGQRRCRTCGARSSPTCSGCPSASTSAGRPAC